MLQIRIEIAALQVGGALGIVGELLERCPRVVVVKLTGRILDGGMESLNVHADFVGAAVRIATGHSAVAKVGSCDDRLGAMGRASRTGEFTVSRSGVGKAAYIERA